MRTFEQTREAFWLGTMRLSLVLGPWLWWCWRTSRLILGPGAPPETVDPDAFISLLISAGMLPVVLPIVVRGVIDVWRSRSPITLGNGWLELPGEGRVEHGDVAEVRLRTGLLHPKIEIEVHRPGGRRRKTVRVLPHEYEGASELRAALMALPTLDRRAAVEDEPAGCTAGQIRGGP